VFKFLIIFFLFLFNFTNSIASEVIYADEAKEMMDDHVKSSELLKVPLPKINRIIKDYQRYKDYRTNVMANNWHYTSYVWKEELGGKILTKDLCTSVIIEFKVPTTPTMQEEVFKRCIDALMDYALIDFEGGIKLYEKIIFNIATADKDKWVYKKSGKDEFNPRDYNLWGVLSPIITFYAVNYDQFNYTEDQHKTIQNYFKEKAMVERFARDGNRSRTKLCPIYNPMKLSGKRHKVGNCGSVRFRFASAELALAILMQDKELWAKGLWDLDYNLSMISKEGYYVNHVGKGCMALGYSYDTSKLISTNVELLNLANFNLLDYKTRHGKTIAEAYEQLFKIYEDITLVKHIAKKGIGAASCGRKPFKTHKEHIIWEFGGKKGYEDALEENWIRNKDDYINWSIRFVSEKHPEWLDGKFTPHEIKVYPWLSQYYHIQAFEIFNANIMSEGENLWTKKLSEKPKDFEKQIAKLEVDETVSEIKEENFSIFNFENGIFKLKSNNVNFTSNTNPIKPKRQKEDQLYKSIIKGNLTNTENKKVILDEALVYKMRFQTDDQMLVVYIGEEPGQDAIMPLFRHRENIQSKCGTRLLNQWGWMSFISETDNEKFASNQQCIHDYFLEIDDVESFEFFEAMLSGSNSILSYLKTNVKKY